MCIALKLKCSSLAYVDNSTAGKIYLSVLFVVLLFKAAILIYWGTGVAPDTAGYTQFSDLILNGSEWLSHSRINESAAPSDIFRIAGYPLFIAFTKTISQENWESIVVLSQFVLTMISLLSFARLICALKIRPEFGCFCLFSAGISFSLFLDNMILTDSFAASIFLFVLSENAVASLRERPLGFPQALFFGVLLALAFMIREGVAILSILFAVPLLIRVFLTDTKNWRSYAGIFVFYLPLILCIQLYSQWNESRTGYRFVTTGGQTVYLQGVMDAARKNEKIFSGDSDLDVTARENITDYSFADVLEIQASLFQKGYVAPELAQLSKEKYFDSWAQYPGSMLRMTIGHIRENYATLTFRPFGAVRDAGLWILGEKPWPDYRELRKSMFEDAGAFVLFVGEMIERVVAIIITAAFVFVPVFWLVQFGRGNLRDYKGALVCSALWAFYFGVLFAHALVHLETRYLAAVVPFSTLIGCIALQKILYRVKA